MTMPNGRLSILPLRNTVLFPGLSQILKVGRPRSVHALHEAERRGFWIIAVQQRKDAALSATDSNASNENTEAAQSSPPAIRPQDVYSVGTLCRVDSMSEKGEGNFQVALRAFSRVRLDDITLAEGDYLEAYPAPLEDLRDAAEPIQKTLLESLRELALSTLELVPMNTNQVKELVRNVDDLSFMTSLCAGHIDVSIQEKQALLEELSLKTRALRLLELMKEFRDGMSLQAEIRNKLNQKLGEQQRQSILREHLKAIRQELDQGESELSLDEKFQKQFDEAGLPAEVRKIAESELRRMTEIGNQSPESHIIRSYLELIVALPWNSSSPDKTIQLDEARQILDADHFGLEPVKKRILQQLAVLKLKKHKQGTILLLVGPPGIGKTSLASSIAKALGRQFVRASVGGVRDESEIRGHRRTYVGALPGRIIQSLKRVGQNNPVFLIDEIDKMGRGFQGDPAAALLEVLDPEQNSHFVDHYLDIGFDLSKVLFIATANQLDGIPAPLLDRMEIIEMSGYTVAEKFNIAKNHLLPKQLDELGILSNEIKVEDDALLRLITSYTREAGVRELDRKIAALIRGSSEKVVENRDRNLAETVSISSLDVENILGSERYFSDSANDNNPPGVVTGLAWTPVGGDILLIETTAMPGQGQLILTGQLGDVMRESAQIAQSLVRSHLADLGIRMDWRKYDLHVHVPSGATPKDGPSAGVSIFSSLVSLLTGRAVSGKLAMTGEITLRGAITPVGGIKEKVIAAHRAGIRNVLLPARNKRDIKDIPKEIIDELEIHWVDRVEDLLQLVFDIKVGGFYPQLLEPQVDPYPTGLASSSEGICKDKGPTLE